MLCALLIQSTLGEVNPAPDRASSQPLLEYSIDANMEETARLGPGVGPNSKLTIAGLEPYGQLKILKLGRLVQMDMEICRTRGTWLPERVSPPSDSLTRWVISGAYRRDEDRRIDKFTFYEELREEPSSSSYPYWILRDHGVRVSANRTESALSEERLDIAISYVGTGHSKSLFTLSKSERETLYATYIEPILIESETLATYAAAAKKGERVEFAAFGWVAKSMAYHLTYRGIQSVTFKDWTRQLSRFDLYRGPAGVKRKERAATLWLDQVHRFVLGDFVPGDILPIGALVSRKVSSLPTGQLWPIFRTPEKFLPEDSDKFPRILVGGQHAD